MSLRQTTRLLTTLVCLLAAPIFAQYTVKKVVFNGAGPYDQSNLQAACGLHPGLAFTTKDLQKSAQQLIDTGLFDDVQARLDGPVKSIDVIFTLKLLDPSHLLPAHFENFVWWTPAELKSDIQSTVPFFAGSLPETGTLLDAVQTALEHMLTTMGITAKVVHAIAEPSTGHPVRSVEYRIESPEIHLRTITLTGVSPNMASAINKVTAAIANSDDREAGDGTTADRILAPYRDAGYFDAALTQEHRTMSQPAPTRVDVDFTATVQPGEVYRLSHIDFAGAPLMSTADFQRTAQLHPEDVVSQKALLATLEPLDAVYRKNGYLDVAANAAPTPDTATHHVAYTVTVATGEQYRLRSVTPINLPPQQLKDFQAAWKLQPGDPYNPDYVKTFLVTMRAVQHQTTLPSAFKVAADPNTHLVDVTITFTIIAAH